MKNKIFATQCVFHAFGLLRERREHGFRTVAEECERLLQPLRVLAFAEPLEQRELENGDLPRVSRGRVSRRA